jgi:hypothetical protein
VEGGAEGVVVGEAEPVGDWLQVAVGVGSPLVGEPVGEAVVVGVSVAGSPVVGVAVGVSQSAGVVVVAVGVVVVVAEVVVVAVAVLVDDGVVVVVDGFVVVLELGAGDVVGLDVAVLGVAVLVVGVPVEGLVVVVDEADAVGLVEGVFVADAGPAAAGDAAVAGATVLSEPRAKRRSAPPGTTPGSRDSTAAR